MIVTCCCTIFDGGGAKSFCNFLLYLTTKHVFENFGVCNCPVAHPLVTGLAAMH